MIPPTYQRNDKLFVPTGELLMSSDPPFLGTKVELQNSLQWLSVAHLSNH